ncbi:MAG: Na+/H+ antiporter subunit E [Kiritimatiellae bacterium]|nr:Na+/H+ antiporter subunit E [Kiritimatiellia bacterium]MDW8459322.1 Na+/H+ antiporter subunit E [Verrucomicrobiota bacterium]
MNRLFSNFLLAMTWAAMTSAFTLPNLVVGFAVGYLALLALKPMLGDSAYYAKFPKTIWFVLYFLKEVIKSSLRVAWDVVTPTHYNRPGIVAIPMNAKTDLEIMLLANLISLTPGTLSLDVSPDRKTLYIHAMFAERPDEIRREIRDGLEKRLLELLR